MITSEKLQTLLLLADKLVLSTKNDNDKKFGTIIQLLVTQVDDLRDEVLWLKEQNESMRFDLEDKKLENRSQHSIDEITRNRPAMDFSRMMINSPDWND